MQTISLIPDKTCNYFYNSINKSFDIGFCTNQAMKYGFAHAGRVMGRSLEKAKNVE